MKLNTFPVYAVSSEKKGIICVCKFKETAERFIKENNTETEWWSVLELQGFESQYYNILYLPTNESTLIEPSEEDISEHNKKRNNLYQLFDKIIDNESCLSDEDKKLLIQLQLKYKQNYRY